MTLLSMQHQIENNGQEDTEWIILQGRRWNIAGIILVNFFPKLRCLEECGSVYGHNTDISLISNS